jgi:hypothetical protein
MMSDGTASVSRALQSGGKSEIRRIYQRNYFAGGAQYTQIQTFSGYRNSVPTRPSAFKICSCTNPAEAVLSSILWREKIDPRGQHVEV